MLKISRRQVRMSDDDNRVFHVDAAKIGLKPGEWPAMFVMEDYDGREILFSKGPRFGRGAQGEKLGGYDYRNRTAGVTISVFTWEDSEDKNDHRRLHC